MARLAAIVLAAGTSSRMSSFKPLLDVGRRSLLDRAISAFEDVGVHDVLVVAGHRAVDVRKVAQRRNVKSVLNDSYASGMFSSVQTGVRSLAEDVERFFLLPVDCALVRPESVGRLAREADRVRSPVVLPTFQGQRGHPPLISSGLVPTILSGDQPGGLQGLLAAQEETKDVSLDDAGATMDIDSDEDVEVARMHASGEELPDEAECAALLRAAPPSVQAHSRAVSRTAMVLGGALNDCGQHLCLALVEASALLHDIRRASPHHAEAAAEHLRGLGYGRVSAVVRQHMDVIWRIGGDVGEAELLYVADKLVQGERLTGMDERLERARHRFGEDSAAFLAAGRRLEVAIGIQRQMEQLLGMPLLDVLGSS